MTGDLKALYLKPVEGEEVHELLTESFASTKVIRDELLEVFAVNANQAAGRPGGARIGGILDRLLEFRSLDYTGGTRFAGGNEALDLFLYELFLYTIAQLIASEDFKLAGNLLDRPYPTADQNHYAERKLPTFRAFYTHSKILDQHNSKQTSGYRDYQSMLISQRCTQQHLPLDLLIQADVVLAVRAIVKEEDSWHPRMPFFRESFHALPLFAEAQREHGFANLAILLGIENRAELAAAFAKRIEEGKHPLSHWQRTRVIANLIALNAIAGS